MVLRLRRFTRGFNTQPPEGGWFRLFYFLRDDKSFNTQPPEGGWPAFMQRHNVRAVSTHSRPKAAGNS